jgi:RimJ/RimL family protein N-acetyltransferase
MGDTQPPMTRPNTEPPRVRLRDITLADADLLDAWDGQRSPYNDFGLPHDPTDRDALARGPLRTERNGQLIVELVADGRPIGTVGWHREMYGPNPESSAFNFGIELIPEARGHGYGTEAQALLVDYLFDNTDVHRVEASTDVSNIAEQRSLEKAGLRREGVTRGAQFRAGAYHDLIVFALLRDDREA